MVHQHFLIVTFPAQGHINPALQLTKRLLKSNIHVTFVTTVFALRRMINAAEFTSPHSNTSHLISFDVFSDGYDHGRPSDVAPHQFMSELKRRNIEALPKLIANATTSKPPITCLIYSILLPWVPQIADNNNLQSALLWIQPATILDIYHHYFNGYGEIIKNAIRKSDHCDTDNDPSCFIKLPKIPFELLPHDLPSHLVSTPFALPSFKEHLEVLARQKNPIVLVNSFDALEPEALKEGTGDDIGSGIKLIGVGPLVPMASFDEKPMALSCEEDHKKCVEWLSSKSESSVVYVSFGSTSVLSKRQMDQMVKGLLEITAPFLWVVRVDEGANKENDDNAEMISNEKLKTRGLIVPWCNQVEVLSHPSIGCFLTHCGWNSCLESLVCGVPVVAFPQWADQPTNAKLVEQMWKNGARMKPNKEGIVEGEEIRKCIEQVMKSEEMIKNAKKWKELAREAIMENGSSANNLKCFIRQIEETIV